MRFETLSISNLRCLGQLEFEPDCDSTLILGPNGSGKTSILEGLALASLGKSFLSNRSTDVVRTGSDGLSVRARLSGAEGAPFSVVVRKRAGTTEIMIDGQAIGAASVLAQRVPILVINSKAADILTESPSNRRALIDRTMFHVEPAYVLDWKQYRIALRQRNELLRRQAPYREARYWDEQLIEFAERIDSRRLRVVAAANSALNDNPLNDVLGRLELDYAPGWNRESAFALQLEAGWQRDLRSGFTNVGIHRADLALRADGKAVARRLSRGQGKFIVCAILLGLAEFMASGQREKPIILVDDLAAELDDKMRGRVVDMINTCGGQRVFTAIKPSDLPELADSARRLFHVEQHSLAKYA